MNNSEWLFVAANFDSQLIASPGTFGSCFYLGEPDGAVRPYYRLTPSVFAYLLDRFEKARAATLAGSLARERFDAADQRFRTVYAWAEERLDEKAVEAAVKAGGQLPPLPIDTDTLGGLVAAFDALPGISWRAISESRREQESKTEKPMPRKKGRKQRSEAVFINNAS